VNRLLLTAELAQRSALRYTPAGLPALDLSLAHASEVSEDGQPRKVSFETRAVAIGAVSAPVAALALGQPAVWSGFLSAARNGRGLLFHVTAVDPLPPTAEPA
jgi:primosomal replication protein N